MLRAVAASLTLLAASCLAVSCGQDAGSPHAPASPARPALWKVSDADTTIFLFGTIHMLPAGAAWRSPLTAQVLSAAQAVYFEADVEGNVAAQTDMVRRIGLLPGAERLSDHLTPEQAQAVAAAAARLGYSLAALEKQTPWYAAVTLADAAIRAAGYGSDTGVETQLRRMAREAGKNVRFLETMERQLSALADLSEPTQVAYLDLTVADLDNVNAGLETMVSAWRSGDVDTLTRLLLDDDIDRLPELRDALLATRNTEWAAKLKTLLEAEPGQILVAVGAAHLLGEDSVQAKLRALGIDSERVQ